MARLIDFLKKSPLLAGSLMLGVSLASAQGVSPPPAPSALSFGSSVPPAPNSEAAIAEPSPLTPPPSPTSLPNSIDPASIPSDLLPPTTSAFSVPGQPAPAATQEIPRGQGAGQIEGAPSGDSQQFGDTQDEAVPPPATAPAEPSLAQADTSSQEQLPEPTPVQETPVTPPPAPADLEASNDTVVESAPQAETEPEAQAQTAPATADQPGAIQDPPAGETAPETQPSEQPTDGEAALDVEAEPALATEPDPNQPAPAIGEGGVRIVYPADEKGVPTESFPVLDELAGRLQRDESLRLQVECFAAGEKETEGKARRLSLIRCLAVRQYFIEKDIRSTRMDIRALGFRSKGQPVDRVDILPAPEGL